MAPWKLTSFQSMKSTDRDATGRLWTEYQEEAATASPSFKNTRKIECEPTGSGFYSDRAFATDLDVNGDGLLDGMSFESTYSTSRVRLHLGYGRRQFDVSTAAGAAVLASESVGDCDDRAELISTVIDLNGDGFSDTLRIDAGVAKFASLVAQDGSSPLAAGRLVAITNGHGARTEISYSNAKIDAWTKHAAPVPEIVVSEVRSRITDGSAADDHTTYYRYGDARYGYDGMSARWSFQGYGRHLVVAGLPSTTETYKVDGVLSLSVFSPLAVPGASFTQVAASNRLESVYQMEGTFHPDDLHHYLIGGLTPFAKAQYTYKGFARSSSFEWAGVSFPNYECGDLNQGAFMVNADSCVGGLVRQDTVEASEGFLTSATNNVMSGSSVLDSDSWGRITALRRDGDLRRSDDDVCVYTTYAATGVTPFPSVVTSVVTTDCGAGGHVPKTLSAMRILYDGLTFGQVGLGRPSSTWVDRYGNGTFLGTFQQSAVTYDALGQVTQQSSTRALGTAATRVAEFTYDPFGLTVISTKSTSSDVPRDFIRATRVSTWPSQQSSATEPNGITSYVEYDHFGRPTRNSVATSGARWTLGQTEYDDTPTLRRVVSRQFPGTTLHGQEATATTVQTATTTVDAMGRQRHTQAFLGSSYGNASIVSGVHQRDALGRVVFAAQAFEGPASAYVPSSAARYGVTTVYDKRGRAVRNAEGTGYLPLAVQTSVASKIYVSESGVYYLDGRAIVTSKGPEETDPTSSRFGYSDETSLTALGREVRRVRRAPGGTVIDAVEEDHDRFGRVTALRRFASPAAGTGVSVWTTVYDSLGNVVQAQEPDVSARLSSYDEDGNLLQLSWLDGATTRIVRQSFDGHNRLTQRDLISIPSGGSETVETSDKYHYDVHSGDTKQPAQPAALLLGQLSWIDNAAVGTVFYGYDPLARLSAEIHRYVDVPGLNSEERTFSAGGLSLGLTLTTPYTTDEVSYGYDSASRMTTVDVGPDRVFSADTVSPLGQYLAVSFGNGTTESYSYSPTGRRELLGTTVNADRPYSFSISARDAAGRVVQEVHSPGSGIINLYTEYDGLGRVATRTQTSGPAAGVEGFTYDGLGNLTTRYSTTGSGNRAYLLSTSDPDRLCRFSAPGSGTSCQFTYDGAGNVKTDTSSGSLRTLGYDAAQRITSISRDSVTAYITYGLGQRYRTSIDGGDKKRTIWNLTGLIERHRNDSSLQERFDRKIPGPLGVFLSLRVALDESGKVEETAEIYNHGDLRANRVFTSKSGEVIQTNSYATYGAITEDSGSSGITRSEELWNGGDYLPEVGLVLLGPRAYDPEIGRFLQRDPITIATRSTSANPYGFPYNDPVNYADPTGMSGLCDNGCPSSAIGIGATMGALGAFALATLTGDGGKGSLPRGAVNASSVHVGTYGPDTKMFRGGEQSYWDQFVAGFTGRLIDLGLQSYPHAYMGYRLWTDPSGLKSEMEGQVLGLPNALKRYAWQLVDPIGEGYDGMSNSDAPFGDLGAMTADTAVSFGMGKMAAAAAAPPANVSGSTALMPNFRRFTRGNFRFNLKKLTGIEPKGAQAHHTLPVKYEGWFRKAGLDIHDPKFGAWWDGGPHQRAASSHNSDFDQFRRLNPNATSGQILAFGRSLAQKYGFDVLY